MLASRRVSYIQTINIWFPSTATLPVLSSKLQECHRRRCNVRRFGPGLCRDWRRESTNQNRVLKAMCFLFLVEIWEGKFQDAFRLLFRFSFFRWLCEWLFFRQHGCLLIDSFLGWPFFWVTLVTFPWVIGFLFTQKNKTLRETSVNTAPTTPLWNQARCYGLLLTWLVSWRTTTSTWPRLVCLRCFLFGHSSDLPII